MIRTRLTLWNTLALAVVLTLLGTVLFWGTRASLFRAVDDELVRRGGFLASIWKQLPSHKPPKDLVAERDPLVDPEQFKDIQFEALISRPRIARLSNAGLDYDHEPWDMRVLRESLRGKVVFFDMSIEGRRVRIMSIPLRTEGKVTGAAQFAANLKETDAAIGRLGSTLLILLPVALIATWATGSWLTRRALQPVARIADAAQQIEATNLAGRLEVSGNDEFGHLASVFNAMLARLETSFQQLETSIESQRQFIADASHELKTPLTAIKTRLGVAKKQVASPERTQENLASLERSTNAMSGIVADLLLLARSEAGQLGSKVRLLPVDSLLEEAAAVVEDAHNREITVQAEGGLNLRGDESGLSRVLVNLMDNAARYSPEGATITATAIAEEGEVVIRITDTGEGIAPEHLPHLFDRFYRVSQARDRESGGLGLGLAIVRSITEAHHGTAEIASQLGHGTAVTLRLPKA